MAGFKVIGTDGDSYLIVDESVTKLTVNTEGRVLRRVLYPAERAMTITAHMPYMAEVDPTEYDVEALLRGVPVLESDERGEHVVIGEGIEAVPPPKP